MRVGQETSVLHASVISRRRRTVLPRRVSWARKVRENRVTGAPPHGCRGGRSECPRATRYRLFARLAVPNPDRLALHGVLRWCQQCIGVKRVEVITLPQKGQVYRACWVISI